MFAFINKNFGYSLSCIPKQETASGRSVKNEKNFRFSWIDKNLRENSTVQQSRIELCRAITYAFYSSVRVSWAHKLCRTVVFQVTRTFLTLVELKGFSQFLQYSMIPWFIDQHKSSTLHRFKTVPPAYSAASLKCTTTLKVQPVTVQ